MAGVISRKYDIILFGATGFTGQYVARELARVASYEKISWAVAGRNLQKLKQVLDSVQQVSGQSSIEEVGLIKADVEDADSLNLMAQKGRTVLNCVGPYRFFGEAVVKACVQHGTNHIDTSGEPAFLENMQLKFSSDAQQNNCYVIGSCGFDSIPADMGTVYLQQLFDGQLNSVETYLKINSSKGGFHGHYATWQSAIYGFANANELKPLRRKLFPKPLPELIPKLEYRGPIHRSKVVNDWCLPFPGSDRSVVMRTQRYFHEKNNKRPVQMAAYVQTFSLWNTLLMALSSMVFMMMTPFRTGQYLLERYPRLFSFGVFDHAGPSDDELKNTSFTLTLVGRGWSESFADSETVQSVPPKKKLIVQVSGPDPGYVATAICVTQAAFVMLQDADKLPPRGGVFTPGAAFAKTSLIERLNKKGIHFRPVIQSQL